MIEPTETESKATLDAFAEVLRRIMEEPAELLHERRTPRPSAAPTKSWRRGSRFSPGRPRSSGE